MDAARIEQAARQLQTAEQTGLACAPIREIIGATDIEAAYAVQQILTDDRLAAGEVIVGRKIGLTNPVVQAQLGVNQPDSGVLFENMDVTALPEVPSERMIQPKAEAEVAFVLGQDLTDGPLDIEQCRQAVAYACAAIEIVDSRVADWGIQITDTVADNGSSALYVLGKQQLTMDQVNPIDVTMEMFFGDELVSSGKGELCLGDPLNALSWLANTAREYGDPLRAGHVILSGALGPMVAVPPGTVVRAVIEPLGEVVAQFSANPNGGGNK